MYQSFAWSDINWWGRAPGTAPPPNPRQKQPTIPFPSLVSSLIFPCILPYQSIHCLSLMHTTGPDYCLGYYNGLVIHITSHNHAYIISPLHHAPASCQRKKGCSRDTTLYFVLGQVYVNGWGTSFRELRNRSRPQGLWIPCLRRSPRHPHWAGQGFQHSPRDTWYYVKIFLLITKTNEFDPVKFILFSRNTALFALSTVSQPECRYNVTQTLDLISLGNSYFTFFIFNGIYI